MASYKPPNENLPIFDSSLFNDANQTVPDISDQYLLFPVAQGAETLQDTTVNGELLVVGETTLNENLVFSSASSEITGLAALHVEDGYVSTDLQVGNDLTVTNNITCNELTYQSLNPPIAGAQTLKQTLELGNNAENLAILNLGELSMTGNIEVNNYDIDSVNQINFFKGGGFGQNSLNTIKFVNVANVPFYLQNGDLDGIDNQTFKMKDDTNDYVIVQNQSVSQIKLNSQNLIRGTSSTNPSNSSYGYIMDTLVRPPMYKQIFHSISSSNPLSLTSGVPTFVFGINIFPTGGDQVYNIGINYAEILFSYFQINFTASSPYVGTNNCQLFLSNVPNPPSYDPSKGNAIIFDVVNNSSGQPNYTFTSSIPIILYYQHGNLGSSFSNLYLNIQIQDTGVYTVALQNCNFVITAYVAGKNSETLVFGN
jgi:hypothetical protein